MGVRADVDVQAMIDECLRAGQAARRVHAASMGGKREQARAIAKDVGVNIRSGVVDNDLLLVARLDAGVWDDTTEVLRQKFGLTGVTDTEVHSPRLGM